jgi:hypothetical protein
VPHPDGLTHLIEQFGFALGHDSLAWWQKTPYFSGVELGIVRQNLATLRLAQE